ncbi:ankyrin-3-like isoform X2 [Episyrphus balteatus]|uniref:ankyrin-3-like isoform X2 n=1 Tax=Episyrphus balteatus TaxID=286459 RepID=UPI002485028F|nr:ankyrin-3-like isoform X2 [Episyrphus balteatus]
MAQINKDLRQAVLSGNFEYVQSLINQHGLDGSESHGGSRVNSRKSKTFATTTPLHIACENGDLEITQMLLDHDADINAPNESSFTPLLTAIQNTKENIIDLLLKRGATLNSCNKGLSPLHYAVGKHSSNITEKLLQYGAYVDSLADFHNSKEFTPLHYACENGDFEIVKVLLKNGANVSFKTTEGLTPLHFACKNGNVETIDILLNSNADINARANNSLTPLYMAVENSHREAAKILMEHGAPINDEYGNGETVLSCAVDKCLPIIVKDILQNCPDGNNLINKKSFKTALSRPGNGYSEIVETMVKYGFSLEHDDINDNTLLDNAIKMGYTEIILDLIKLGLDLSRSGDILHIPVKNNNFEVTKFLLTHGADVNATDSTGRPAIFFSTYDSNVEMTKLLLFHGANVQKSPELLRIATNKVCKEIVEMLLEKKADVEAADKFGRTSLHLAASQEFDGFLTFFKTRDKPEIMETKAEIAKMLLINGAKVNAKTTKDGLTALHIACGKEFTNVVEVLLEYQADVDYVAKGVTPLHIAAQKGNATIIEMLLKNYSKVVNFKEQANGDTALHIIAEKGNKQALETLLKYGADVNLKNNKHDTALHLAVKGTNTEIVSILLEHNMSPIDSQNIDDNTPLHIAVKLAKIDIVQALLNFGADINIFNNRHDTALDLANCLRYVELADVFNDSDEFEDEEESYEAYCNRQNRQEPSYNDRMYILRILLIHAITLKVANLYPAKTDLYSFLEDNTLLEFFQEDCEAEIEVLKMDKIAGNTKLSFYDILTKSINSLARCVRNKNVVRIFESNDYKEKFPIYAGIIERNFKKATQRRQLVDTAYEFFKCYFEMPYECADQILSYLSNGDLENIIESRKI